MVALPGNATLERDYPTLVPTDLTAAELPDLQRMADQDGIGIDAAISAYAWQDRFAALADQLRLHVSKRIRRRWHYGRRQTLGVDCLQGWGACNGGEIDV